MRVVHGSSGDSQINTHAHGRTHTHTMQVKLSYKLQLVTLRWKHHVTQADYDVVWSGIAQCTSSPP
jgi:hypothetical protein